MDTDMKSARKEFYDQIYDDNISRAPEVKDELSGERPMSGVKKVQWWWRLGEWVLVKIGFL
jgi:hypothetical protein